MLPVNPAPALPPPSPVVVHISDDHGYVWDAVGAQPSPQLPLGCAHTAFSNSGSAASRALPYCRRYGRRTCRLPPARRGARLAATVDAGGVDTGRKQGCACCWKQLAFSTLLALLRFLRLGDSDYRSPAGGCCRRTAARSRSKASAEEEDVCYVELHGAAEEHCCCHRKRRSRKGQGE